MDGALALVGGSAAVFLSGVAALAFAHKLIEPDRTRAAAANLLGASAAHARSAHAASCAVELVAAALLPTTAGRAPAAAALLTLWSAYTLLLIKARRAGGLADCGCSLGRQGAPHGFDIARNQALMAFALWLAVAPAEPLSLWGWILAAPAALAFLALYLAADQAGGIRRGAVR
jgi:hypothetical protein